MPWVFVLIPNGIEYAARAAITTATAIGADSSAKVIPVATMTTSEFAVITDTPFSSTYFLHTSIISFIPFGRGFTTA